MNKQPNIMLLMADQLADPWLAQAHTPAIDSLAAEGVTFINAYSNSPLCAPARFSMMSGQLPSKIGAYDNAAEFPSSVPTFAHHLRTAGYQTSLIGKMHFVGPDQLHGFEERNTTDIYPADFGWTPNWEAPDERAAWWFHNMDSVVEAGVVSASNQLDYDDEVTFQAVRKIRDLARKSDDRPWFTTVSFTHPHDPYVCRQQFWDLYDHEAVPMPTVAILAHDDPHSHRLRRLMLADSTDVSQAQVRDARHAYLANVSYVDAQIGLLLDTLASHGLTEDTVVLFTADHGDMLGERGLWYKMNFFEPSVRVPMILRAPSTGRSGVVTTPVSLLDVAPTLLDLAGAAPSERFDGSSLLGLMDPDNEGLGDDDAGADRTILGEYYGEGAVAPMFMIRRETEKYIWSEPDPPQLYDLQADPSEVHNLATAGIHNDRFEEEVLQRWDVAALDDAVRASQRERTIVNRSLRRGRYTPWDHQPFVNAAEHYMRNHLDLNDVERSRRS